MHTTALPDWANSVYHFRHVDLWYTDLSKHECRSITIAVPSLFTEPSPSSGETSPPLSTNHCFSSTTDDPVPPPPVHFHWTNITNTPRNDHRTNISNALQIVSYIYPQTPVITSFVAPIFTVRGDENLPHPLSPLVSSSTPSDTEQDEQNTKNTTTIVPLIPSRVTAVALSKSFHRMFIGTETGLVRLWNIDSLKSSGSRITETYKYTGHISDVTSIQWFPSDQVSLSTSIDHRIQVWDATIESSSSSSTDTPPLQAKGIRPAVVTLRGHTGGVLCTAPLKKGSLIVTGSRDGTLRIWRLSTSTCIQTINLGVPIYRIQILTTDYNDDDDGTSLGGMATNQDSLGGMATNQDSTSESSSITAVHTYTSTVNEEISSSETFLLDGTLLVVGSQDNCLRIVTLSTDYDTHLYDNDYSVNTPSILPNPVLKEIRLPEIHSILSLNYVSFGDWLIIGGNDGRLSVYRLEGLTNKKNKILQVIHEWSGKVGEGHQTADVVCMKSFSIVPYLSISSFSSSLSSSSVSTITESITHIRIVIGLSDSICGIYTVSPSLPYAIQLVQLTNPLSYGIRDIDIGILNEENSSSSTLSTTSNSSSTDATGKIITHRVRVITGSNDGYVRVYDLPYQVIVHMLNANIS